MSDPSHGRREEFYILTKAHTSIFPQGVILFWAAKRQGYSGSIEMAGKYSREEAESICVGNKRGDFMVPCDIVEAEAFRVVDIDKFKKLTGVSQHDRT